MGKKRITKILSLLLVMLTTMSISAFAAQSAKYAKAIATAVGAGKVYIGKVSNDPKAEDYQETIELTHGNNSTTTTATVNFYLFAQPDNATTKFDGWYENKECTGDAVSTDNPYNAKIVSTATTEAAAVTKNYYAKFIEIAISGAAVVNNGDEIALSDTAEVAVEKAEAISAKIASYVREASYVVRIMKEDGSEWVASDTIAMGEMSINGNAYAEFDEPITFDPGSKYQVTISVKGSDENVETIDYVISGASIKLANGDFAEGNVGDVNIATYKKDGKICQMQEVPGWSFGVENGDARAAGVVAYGSGTTLGGSSYTVPAEGPEGTNGYALGMVGVWTGTIQYVQDVTLPAGKYTMTVPVYNTLGNNAFVKNLIGVKYGTTENFATTLKYPVGEWTDETINFELTEKTQVTVSLGYQGANVGSGASQHLFIDCVKIEPYKHIHDYAEAWSSDSINHWHECAAENCDEPQGDKAAHGYGTSFVDSTYYTCNVCAHEDSLRLVTYTQTHETADSIIALIDSISNPWEYSQACVAKIDAARAAYNAFATDSVHIELVTNYNALENAEKAYVMMDAIAAVDSVLYTDGPFVEELNGKYNELDTIIKPLIANHNLLTYINEAYDVVLLIGGISDSITVTPECKAAIDTARVAYEALCDTAQAYVGNRQSLFNAEAEYNRLVLPSTELVIKTDSLGNTPVIPRPNTTPAEGEEFTQVVNVTEFIDNDLEAVNDTIVVDLTAEEEEQGVWVWMEVKEQTEEMIAADEEVKEAVEEIIAANGNNNMELGTVITVNIYKQIPGEDKVNVEETAEPVEIQITVPEELVESGRQFWINNFHGNAVNKIKPKRYDKEKHVMYFDADQFSVYAIVYSDGEPYEFAQDDKKTTIKFIGDRIIFASGFMKDMGADIESVDGTWHKHEAETEDEDVEILSNIVAMKEFEFSYATYGLTEGDWDIILPKGFFVFLNEEYDFEDTNADIKNDEPAADARRLNNVARRAAMQSEKLEQVQAIQLTISVKNGVVTSISNVKTVSEDTVVYDLAGRKLNVRDAKGIIIVDGKKFVK